MIEVVLPNGQKVRVDTTDPEVAAEYGRKFFESDAAAPRDRGPLAFTNQAIAKFLGVPLNMVSGSLLGTEDVVDAMRSIGISVAEPDAKPEGAGAYVGRALGEGASALLPLGAVSKSLQAATQAPKFVRNIAGDVIKTFGRRPVATTALEATASTGAGLGRYMGERDFPDQPALQSVSEIGGGLLGAFRPGAIAWGLGRTPGVGLIKKGVFPFTTQGGKLRASDRVRSLVADPEDVARRLQKPSESDLPATVLADEPRLMALAKEVGEQDPVIEADLLRQAGEARKELTQSLRDIRGVGDIGDTRDFVAQRVANIAGRMDSAISQARATAQSKIDTLAPTQKASESSIIMRDELEKALKSARDSESKTWAKIPDNETVPVDIARARYIELRDSLPRAQNEDMPKKAYDFLDPDASEPFGASEAIKEVRGLYSALREASRQARAQGNFNEARLSKEIADSILDDIGARANNATDVGRAFNEARAFSLALNKKYTQGTVGKLLGYAEEGGPSIAPEVTLARSIGSTREAGLVGARDLLRAIEGDPDVGRAAIEQYIKQKFYDAALDSRTGKVNPTKAGNFIRNNSELLDEAFPALKQQLMDANAAQRIADDIEIRLDARKKKIQSPRVAYASEFLNTSVNREMGAIIKSKNSIGLATDLRKKAVKDKTGQALRGLKSGFVDYILDRARTNEFDEAQDAILSGTKIMGALKEREVNGVANVLLTSQERARLRRIAGELAKLEKAAGSLPKIDGIIKDTPNLLISFAARTIAARRGAALGQGISGASLLTANFATRLMNSALGRITNDKAAALISDAVQDKDLLYALLTRLSSPAARKAVSQKLGAWAAGPGSRVLEQDGDDQTLQ